MDVWIDKWMHGWINGCMDGQRDHRYSTLAFMDGPKD